MAKQLLDAKRVRWGIVVSRFEECLYADPEQDLDAVWWDLVERYQFLRLATTELVLASRTGTLGQSRLQALLAEPAADTTHRRRRTPSRYRDRWSVPALLRK